MKSKKHTTALLAALACMSLLGMTAHAEETIGQGVSIAGVDVQGMTYAQAEMAVKEKVNGILNSTIDVEVGEDHINATAVDFGLQWKNRKVVNEAFELGNSGNLIKRYKDTQDLAREPKDLALHFSANEDAVRTFIEGKCKQFEKEPQDAEISSDGSGGFNLTPGVTGQVLDVDASVTAVMDYIANEWEGNGTVALSVETEAPKGDTKDLEQITDLLGTYTTYYGSTYGRNVNVERGAELINGHVIWPGESFSVCDHLVPFTAENGYEQAGAYEEGRVVQDYGGGICQVSTTLYNALLRAEIQIDERHNHTMSVSYVPIAMDAAIAEGLMDLVFTNNQKTPIFISGYAYGGELTFSVYGKETRPEDRYVEFYSETVSTTEVPTTTVLYARDDQNVGYFQQVQSAAAGSTGVLYKSVTYNGETTTEQINTSTYQPIQTSYEVGTIGASQALLNAIYSNDLAGAQLAATGVVTVQTETNQSESNATDTTGVVPDGTITTPQTDVTGGYYMDTPDGEVYVPGAVDDGVVLWQ
ncbi:MAG: VanW family protein [Eubacteriales bacterium]|nr:VanW family protein [Eubacteriales bacterium]